MDFLHSTHLCPRKCGLANVDFLHLTPLCTRKCALANVDFLHPTPFPYATENVDLQMWTSCSQPPLDTRKCALANVDLPAPHSCDLTLLAPRDAKWVKPQLGFPWDPRRNAMCVTSPADRKVKAPNTTLLLGAPPGEPSWRHPSCNFTLPVVISPFQL